MDLEAFLRGEQVFLEGRGFAGLTERPPRKPLINGARDRPLDDASRNQEPIARPVLTSQDAREGAQALAEKRPAGWRGR